MKKFRRRTFLQWLLGIFGVGSVGLPKKKDERFNRNTTSYSLDEKKCKKAIEHLKAYKNNWKYWQIQKVTYDDNTNCSILEKFS